MTEIKVKIVRHAREVEEDIDALNERELDEFIKAHPDPKVGWLYARLAAKWIRDNVARSKRKLMSIG